MSDSLTEMVFGGWGEAVQDALQAGKDIVTEIGTATAEMVKSAVKNAPTVSSLKSFWESGGKGAKVPKPKTTMKSITEKWADEPSLTGGNLGLTELDADLAEEFALAEFGPEAPLDLSKTAVVTAPTETELTAMNVGRAAQQTLTELMHDLPELDGQVGALDMNDVDDLETALNTLKNEQPWSDPNAELKAAFQRQKEAGLGNRDAMRAARAETSGSEPIDAVETEVTRQQTALADLEMTDMSGTGTSPVELQLYENLQQTAPEVLEQLEEKAAELPKSMQTVRIGLDEGDWSVELTELLEVIGPDEPTEGIQPFEIEDASAMTRGEMIEGLQKSYRWGDLIERLQKEYKTGSWKPYASADDPGAYTGKAGRLQGDWPEARVSGPNELLGPELEEPLLPAGMEMLTGIEEAAAFAAESIGGSLLGPGIGMAFFIIQTLWANAQAAYTDRLRQEGFEKHFFEPRDPDVPIGDSLMYGQLGYCCKFFEFDPESKTHHAWNFGDQNVWLPIFVFDQYDVYIQCTVTRADGTTRDAVCYFWDVLWLAVVPPLSPAQQAKFIPFVNVGGHMVSVRPGTLVSWVCDLGTLTRNSASVFLELNRMGYVWFRADGAGSLPQPDWRAENSSLPHIITEPLAVTHLWHKAYCVYLVRDHNSFVKYYEDERRVAEVVFYMLLQTPYMKKNNTAFWFVWGKDGLLYRDTPQVASACILANYQILHNRLAIAKYMSGATGFGGFPVDADTDDGSVIWNIDDEGEGWGFGGTGGWGSAPDSDTVTVDYTDWVDKGTDVYVLPPDDPRKFRGAPDYTKMGTGPYFEGDERALRAKWLDIQRQKNWWKTERYHNKPIVNRGWKIAHRAKTKAQKQLMREYRAQFVTVIPKYFPAGPSRRRLAGADLVKRDLNTSQNWDWQGVFDQFVRLMGYLGVKKYNRSKQLIPGFPFSMESVITRKRTGVWNLFVDADRGEMEASGKKKIRKRAQKVAPQGDLEMLDWREGEKSALVMLVKALQWRGFKVSSEHILDFLYPAMTEVGDEGTPADELTLDELVAREAVLQPIREWLEEYYGRKDWKATDAQEFDIKTADPYYADVTRELEAIESAIARKKAKPRKKPVPVPSFDTNESDESGDELEAAFTGYEDEEMVTWSAYQKIPARDEYENEAALGWVSEPMNGLVVEFKRFGVVHYGFILKELKTKYRVQTADSIQGGTLDIYPKKLAIVAKDGKMHRVNVTRALMPPPPKPPGKPHPKPALPLKPLPSTPPDSSDEDSEEEELTFVPAPDRPQRERRPAGFYTEQSLSPSVAREFRAPPDDGDMIEFPEPDDETDDADAAEGEDSKADEPEERTPGGRRAIPGISQRRDPNPGFVKKIPADISVEELAEYVVSETEVHGSRPRKQWYCPYCEKDVYSNTAMRKHLTAKTHFINKNLANLRSQFVDDSSVMAQDDIMSVVTGMTALTRDASDLPLAGPDYIPQEPSTPVFPRDAQELAAMDTALEDEFDALDAENARFNRGLTEETNFEERLAALRGEGRPRPDRPGTPPPDWRPTPEEVEESQVQRGDNVLTFLLVGVMFIVAASYMT